MSSASLAERRRTSAVGAQSSIRASWPLRSRRRFGWCLIPAPCSTSAAVRARSCVLADRLPPTVQLVGVDPASAMIDVARAARGPRSNVQLEVAYAEDLPFSDAQFDLVISTTSFHHWTDQAVGLREVGRVARRDGRLVLVDNFAIGWLRVFNAIARRKMRTRGDVERLLASARLMPLEWARIFDLGPLPLIQAVVAKHAPQSA
jgi:SAM-dependent methyltransferase